MQEPVEREIVNGDNNASLHKQAAVVEQRIKTVQEVVPAQMPGIQNFYFFIKFNLAGDHEFDHLMMKPFYRNKKLIEGRF